MRTETWTKIERNFLNASKIELYRNLIFTNTLVLVIQQIDDDLTKTFLILFAIFAAHRLQLVTEYVSACPCNLQSCLGNGYMLLSVSMW